tara:strand:+ start:17301 stop:18011 length:711 start_codon:yes stop_codon:yes gene_type:complete
MALPKLNESIKYTTKIPSTGEQVSYRPFLIKEEKILLIAMETQDEKIIINSIGDTVNACVIEDIDAFSLPLFDLEYLFLQIRSKSVGETSTVSIGCKSCGHRNEVTIPIDEIKITVPKAKKHIELNNDITLLMKYPSLSDILKTKALDGNNTEIERNMETFYACLEAVETSEERFLIADETHDEIEAFVESLTSSQFEHIKKFVDTIPTLRHTVKYKCQSCGTENTRILQGTNDFF